MIQSLEAAACQRQPTRPAQGLNMRAAQELNTTFKRYALNTSTGH